MTAVLCTCPRRWDDSIKVNNIRSTPYISSFLVSRSPISFLHPSIHPIDRTITGQPRTRPQLQPSKHTPKQLNMAPTVLHLRAETKPLEHRSALTPTTAKALIDAGYEVHVEKGCGVKSGTTRIFDDAEFEKVGAKIVEEESWIDAPADHIIVGLKELREETFPLKHVHVQFAHCYKGQENWNQVLARFPRGGGTLLDLEFLADPNTGRRVAAFGYEYTLALCPDLSVG